MPDLPDLPGASDALRELAARGVARSYAKGRLLIEEGDTGDTLYIVLDGRLRAYSSSADGSREVTYGTYGPGEYVGEMSLDGGPRSAHVEALERSTCIVVARATLEAFIAEHPAFAFELLAKVIRRARAATLTARQMALNDVYGRLRLLLQSLAVPQPDGGALIAERLTHKQVAQRIGCSREMVSRVLKDLERGGHVAHDVAGRLTIRRALPPRW
ncbi:MAG: Crp/Fnr family transcriptional regulator [Gammaproteobacteria bacterium]